MSQQLGAVLVKPHLHLRPDTGGKIIVDGAITEEVFLKSHNNYNSSGVHKKTFAVSTADNTATVIASIAVPVGFALAVRAFVIGMQDDASDASTFTGLGVGTNAAAATAMKGTALYQVVESAGGTDFTITANDTTDSLELKVTGVAAENWAWVASVEYQFIKTAAA